MAPKEAPPRRRWCVCVTLVLAGGFVSLPHAGADILNPVFSIQATNDSGSGSFSATFDQGVWDPVTQTYTWSLAAPLDLLDGPAHVATLQGGDLTIDAGSTPQFDLSFEVIAGSSHTEFAVDSALLSFATISADEAAGRFVVGATVWDLSEPSDGVWIIGRGPSMGIFQALYNGRSPDGSVFREALGVVGIGPGGGMASGGEVYPNAGYAPFNDQVSDMSVHSAFMLTADDHARGTATYGVVPEPTALLLLAVGGTLMGGRRRA